VELKETLVTNIQSYKVDAGPKNHRADSNISEFPSYESFLWLE